MLFDGDGMYRIPFEFWKHWERLRPKETPEDEENLTPLMLAAKAKASACYPALTTIVDITGLFIYFSTAKFILGI